jgi:hypothetical protein
MSKCTDCNGNGRCRWCSGTGKRGYPGWGSTQGYEPCPYCDASGVCHTCKGAGG